MAAKEYTPTRVGMLLLDPSGPYVWAVKSKTKVVRIFGGIAAEGTLTKGAVPPEWRIIDGDGLAHKLVNKVGDLTNLGRHLLTEPKQGS